MCMEGRIVKVSGPLIVAEGLGDSEMYDVVRVSDEKLIGEVIELRGDMAWVQVYEETSGLGPGEPVYTTGALFRLSLGRGLSNPFLTVSSGRLTRYAMSQETASAAASR